MSNVFVLRYQRAQREKRQKKREQDAADDLAGQRKREFEEAMAHGGSDRPAKRRRRTGLVLWEVLPQDDSAGSNDIIEGTTYCVLFASADLVIGSTCAVLTIPSGGHEAYEGMVEELMDDGDWVVDTTMSLKPPAVTT